MNNSFSAEELTNMQLPMLPKTRQAIEIKAKNDGWQFQFVKSNGRNGQKKLFLLSGMPQEVQEAIKEQQIANMLKESKPAPLPRACSHLALHQIKIQASRSMAL